MRMDAEGALERGGIGIHDRDRENYLRDMHLPFSFLAGGYGACGCFRNESRRPAGRGGGLPSQRVRGWLGSGGDNWFVFHLLSEGDLRAVKKANAHFSDDLLSSLLNEPIPGHGVFWSSSGDQPYPIPIRALLFEAAYEPLDPRYNRPSLDCYAARLGGSSPERWMPPSKRPAAMR